jgi:hypothetical protein
MARIHPSGWREMQATGAAQREIETLALLAEALPDAYTVYHGVHWTRVERGWSVFGEVDFAVVAPSGRLLLIEQKSGFLEETPEGLVKVYAHGEKKVAVQLARNVEALQKRFAEGSGGDKIHPDILLYCPDYTVRQPAIAGLDPARIVDASSRGRLASVIQSILPAGEPDEARAGRVHRFLRDELRLAPEIGAIVGQAEALYTRISGGLAAWGRRIECEPFRLRVIGTAGSGKTQLALAVYRDAVAAGRRPLYLCFNRPLADHLAAIVPPGGEVATYHQLCDRVVRSLGRAPDFSAPEPFARLEAEFAAADPGPAWAFDELIVDEGQDFSESWKDAALRLLRPGARAWWLEDPMQNLYRRPPVALPGWVRLRSDTNYRSPRDILGYLNRLVPPERPIEAGSPLGGSEVAIHSYADSATLIEETKLAITRALQLGFRRNMIALVTFRGREHSLLAPYDRLGPHSLRKFTGGYDLLGSPLYTVGDILLETVYRFKGQSAPCVILTEIDFETLDELALRKLFVGATRATMKLMLVLSERAAKLLLGRLDQGP